MRTDKSKTKKASAPETRWEAIEAAAIDGEVALHKYADPTEGARRNISLDEAREIAKQDPGLIWCTRTIPAEKPTADMLRTSTTLTDEQSKLLAYKAHAAKLAEALRSIVHGEHMQPAAQVVHLRNIARQALAAWEGVKQ